MPETLVIENPQDGDSRPKEGFDATGTITGSGHNSVSGELVKNGFATPGRTIQDGSPWIIRFPAMTGGTLATGPCRINVDCGHCDVFDSNELDVTYSRPPIYDTEGGEIRAAQQIGPGSVLVIADVKPNALEVYGVIYHPDGTSAGGTRVLFFEGVVVIAFTCVPKGNGQIIKLKAEHTGKVLHKKKINIT